MAPPGLVFSLPLPLSLYLSSLFSFCPRLVSLLPRCACLRHNAAERRRRAAGFVAGAALDRGQRWRQPRTIRDANTHRPAASHPLTCHGVCGCAQGKEADLKELVSKYRLVVEGELTTICNEILALLTDVCLVTMTCPSPLPPAARRQTPACCPSLGSDGSRRRYRSHTPWALAVFHSLHSSTQHNVCV